MILKKFKKLEDLNYYLKDAKNVKKVKLLTEGNLNKLTTVFYVLTDEADEYQTN